MSPRAAALPGCGGAPRAPGTRAHGGAAAPPGGASRRRWWSSSSRCSARPGARWATPPWPSGAGAGSTPTWPFRPGAAPGARGCRGAACARGVAVLALAAALDPDLPAAAHARPGEPRGVADRRRGRSPPPPRSSRAVPPRPRGRFAGPLPAGGPPWRGSRGAGHAPAGSLSSARSSSVGAGGPARGPRARARRPRRRADHAGRPLTPTSRSSGRPSPRPAGAASRRRVTPVGADRYRSRAAPTASRRDRRAAAPGSRRGVRHVIPVGGTDRLPGPVSDAAPARRPGTSATGAGLAWLETALKAGGIGVGIAALLAALGRPGRRRRRRAARGRGHPRGPLARPGRGASPTATPTARWWGIVFILGMDAGHLVHDGRARRATAGRRIPAGVRGADARRATW